MSRKIDASTSPRLKAELKSLQNVLLELKTWRYLPLAEAYQEYIAKLPTEFHPKIAKKDTVRDFGHRILSKKGLPVILVRANGTKFVMLWENSCDLKTSKNLQTLDELLSMNICGQFDDTDIRHIESLLPLLTSAHDRAVVMCVLSLIFSATLLRHLFGMHEDVICAIKSAVLDNADEKILIEKNATEEAKENIKGTILSLEKRLVEKEATLSLKRKRLDKMEIDNQEADLFNLKLRVERLKTNLPQLARRVAATAIKKWKSTLFSRKGQGRGRVKIDRGAELAIYNVLQEQLVAHKSRKGPAMMEKRVTVKEMRHVANEWLKTHGKPQIKSYETARSWGKSRRSRSIQSVQHRGRSLWSYCRPQKRYTDRHINTHYNRAHIKMYTRKVFSYNTCLKKFTIRRCIDDKAYLRCGTSEGFSRPKHMPLSLVEESPELPAYDFAESVGYIAPGMWM